jgi:hypothetical protein
MSIQSFDRERVSTLWQSDEAVHEKFGAQRNVAESATVEEVNDRRFVIVGSAMKTDLNGTVFAAHYFGNKYAPQ